jgi:hypothetical protein
MRNELLEYGYVRDMMALGEELPTEVVVWLLEHGILARSFSSRTNDSCL